MSYTYTFAGYGGVDNCDKCDRMGGVIECTRSDGKAALLCRDCMTEAITR